MSQKILYNLPFYNHGFSIFIKQITFPFVNIQLVILRRVLQLLQSDDVCLQYEPDLYTCISTIFCSLVPEAFRCTSEGLGNQAIYFVAQCGSKLFKSRHTPYTVDPAEWKKLLEAFRQRIGVWNFSFVKSKHWKYWYLNDALNSKL